MEVNMDTLFIMFFLIVIGTLIGKSNQRKGRSNFSSEYFSQINEDRHFPNSYSASDYHEYGIYDSDIEMWGLDQPGAPDPASSGFVIMDMLDGDIDGDFNF
jgi:hypothetical protein